MDISERRTEAKILWTSSSVEGLVAAQRSTDRKMSTSGAQNESLEMISRMADDDKLRNESCLRMSVAYLSMKVRQAAIRSGNE